MPGKSPSYRPNVSSEDLHWSEEGADEEEYQEGVNAMEAGELTNFLDSDAALDVDAQGSQQLGFGEYSSQIPLMSSPEPAAPDASADTLFPEGHIFDAKDIGKCVLAQSKKIHVSELVWDKSTRLGQTRALSTKLVGHYVARLKANPPRLMVRVLVKATSGSFCLRRVGVNNNTLFTDGHYVPLGGQHISAAILAMWKSLGGADNETGIPLEFQYVDAEILKANTPLDICRLAAGEHQLAQKDVQSMSVADAFAFMVKAAREKGVRHGTTFLTDKEVGMLCEQLGLQKFRDKSGNELSETQAVCFLHLVSYSHNLSSQRTIMIQAWRPLSFWASCCCADDVIAQKVQQVNTGCAQDKEIIRAATIKEYGTLNVEDFQCFSTWLLEQERPQYKQVVAKFTELRHRRWAWWHVMAPDNPKVDAACSMPFPRPQLCALIPIKEYIQF